MISAELLPNFLAWSGWFFALLIISKVLYDLPKKSLLKVFSSHLFLGSCLALGLLWGLRAGFVPGLSFHLLGVTALTLMLGWHFALLAVALVLAVGTAYWGIGWQTYGINVLLIGALPIAVSHFLLTFAQRKLPHNFFVYTLLNAFFAAALSSLLVVLMAVALLLLSGVAEYSRLAYEYLPFTPLMLFAEGVFNGLLVTFLVLAKPDWVSTFSDELYLHGK